MLKTLKEKINALPAYQPNSWGAMVEGDQDDPIFFPARIWIRRADVLELLTQEDQKVIIR